MSTNKWIKWALGESGTKTISGVLMKYIGVAIQTPLLGFASTLVIGMVQMLGGFFGAKASSKTSWIPDRRSLTAALAFGIVATAMTILSIMTFTYGADLGVRTFLIALAIIPGALIDRICFKTPFLPRQWLGIAAFILAGYAILDFPSLANLATLPLWVWLTLVIAALAAINEGLSRASTRITPMINNFWVGLATIISCAAGLAALRATPEAILAAPAQLWINSIIIGFIVFGMIAFKLLSYQGGGTIALKKIVMQGSYLILSMIAGVLLFHEPLTAGKIIGIAGFFVAFSITDNETWRYISQKFFL